VGAIGEAEIPFDRMLAAQAQAENHPLITNDPVFQDYGVTTIW
jgi:PIN domain nuclease of toxin-antitoxin system